MKRSYYFNVSNGHLVKVSHFRFCMRKLFHFSIRDYRLVVLCHYPDLNDDDLVLVWIPVLRAPF